MMMERVKHTSNRSIATMTAWALSIQNLPGEHLGLQLDIILDGIKYILNYGAWSTSTSVQVEALQALSKLLTQVNADMKREAMLLRWLPCVFPRLLHTDPRVRDTSWMLLSSVQIVTTPSSMGPTTAGGKQQQLPPTSISQALFDQMPQSLLKAMNDIMLQDTQQETAAAAASATTSTSNNHTNNTCTWNTDLLQTLLKVWGKFIPLLGTFLFKDNLINALLKIPQKTFLHPSVQLRLLTLDVWTNLMDHFGRQKGGLLVVKRLHLIMLPLVNNVLTDKDLSVRQACITTWRYLVTSVLRASSNITAEVWQHLCPPAMVSAAIDDHTITMAFLGSVTSFLTQVESQQPFVVTACDAILATWAASSTATASSSPPPSSPPAGGAFGGFHQKLNWFWSFLQQLVVSKTFLKSAEVQRAASELGKLLIHRTFHSASQCLRSPMMTATASTTTAVTKRYPTTSIKASGSQEYAFLMSAFTADIHQTLYELQSICALPVTSLLRTGAGAAEGASAPPRLDLVSGLANAVIDCCLTFSGDFVATTINTARKQQQQQQDTNHVVHLLCMATTLPAATSSSSTPSSSIPSPLIPPPQAYGKIMARLSNPQGNEHEPTAAPVAGDASSTNGSGFIIGPDILSHLILATSVSLCVLPRPPERSSLSSSANKKSKLSNAKPAHKMLGDTADEDDGEEEDGQDGEEQKEETLLRENAYSLLRQILSHATELPQLTDCLVSLGTVSGHLKRLVSQLVTRSDGNNANPTTSGGGRGGGPFEDSEGFAGMYATTSTAEGRGSRRHRRHVCRLNRACLQTWRYVAQATHSVLGGRAKEFLALSPAVKVLAGASVDTSSSTSSPLSMANGSSADDMTSTAAGGVTTTTINNAKLLMGSLSLFPALLIAQAQMPPPPSSSPISTSTLRALSRFDFIALTSAGPSILGPLLAEWRSLYQTLSKLLPQQHQHQQSATKWTGLSMANMVAVRVMGWLRRLPFGKSSESASAAWYLYAQLLVPLVLVIVEGLSLDDGGIDWSAKLTSSSSSTTTTPSTQLLQIIQAILALTQVALDHFGPDNHNHQERNIQASDIGGGDSNKKDPISLSVLCLSTLQQLLHQVDGVMTRGGAAASATNVVIPIAIAIQNTLQTVIGLPTTVPGFLEEAPQAREAAQTTWVTLCTTVQRCITPTQCDSKLLDTMAPLLALGFTSKYRAVKNATVQLWQGTFGRLPSSTKELQYPPGLADVLLSLSAKMGGSSDAISLPGLRNGGLRSATTSTTTTTTTASTSSHRHQQHRDPSNGHERTVGEIDSLAVEPYASPSLAFPIPMEKDKEDHNTKKRKDMTLPQQPPPAQPAAKEYGSNQAAGSPKPKRRKYIGDDGDNDDDDGLGDHNNNKASAPAQVVSNPHHASSTSSSWMVSLDDLCNPDRVASHLPKLTMDDIARAQAKLLSVLTLLNDRLLR
jgi:hypothetical protein